MNRLVNYLWKVDEFYVLARNLLFEARSETDLGMTAVGWVVLNRVKDRRWPDTIKGVILQQNQFSWTRSDDPQYKWGFTPWLRFPLEWRRAKKITELLLKGGTPDPSRGANHYLNVQACLNSRWGVPRWYAPAKVTRIIGRHTFLKL